MSENKRKSGRHKAAEDGQGAEGGLPRVGRQLAESRERYGLSLREVADALKIRYVFLEAIEQGRLDNLPGPTYAIGFVRAYGDYLGLDSEALVNQFKSEIEGLPPRPQLVFPSPVPEGRFPGAAVLLISLILAGLVYGGWYLVTERQDLVDRFVAQSPEEVLEDTPPGEAAPADSPTPEPAPVVDSTVKVVEPAPAEIAEPAPAELAEPAPAELAEPAPEAADETAEEVVVVPEIPEAPEPPATEAVPEAPVVDQAPAAVDAPAEAETEADVLVEEAVEAEAESAAEAPATEAAGDRDRVVIRATEKAWVQVEDADRRVLLTAVLQPGEEYEVPDQPGLMLNTGNAGGTVIVIDGVALPPLGDSGRVRRNVVLDPEVLRSQAGNQ